MSDFSELCPLFNTGVYSELTLPYIDMNISSTGKADGGYKFGRSVIITAAFIKKHTAFTATATATKAYICRQASIDATKTVFASIALSATDTTATAVPRQWKALTVTAKTFSATQLLVVRTNKGRTGMKHCSFIIRYKEK
jgi:hypothetical protein